MIFFAEVPSLWHEVYNRCLSVVIVEVNLRSRPLSQKLSLVYWYTGRRLYVSIVLDSGIMITIRVCPRSQEERESTCVATCHCCDTGIRWWKYKIGFGFCDPYEKNSMWQFVIGKLSTFEESRLGSNLPTNGNYHIQTQIFGGNLVLVVPLFGVRTKVNHL